ncbi:MBL fold metallo-hydrolase [Sinorhizobium americanum]|uniref:Glyoxylase-like metal-dependent hydrolase (Beta-lactamase superfamily II) n=1 Tax=Sinorhizobium americanum TaxID=194963 RepID=A0A4R2C0R0_9HYPH|nr:MBL fold metallo-hydrolase [Sinorhizobium americanum]TCN33928.1 glyoxylase-like metal-dependent hydrolase (beta-lactamase superfamily II) [Sinorhizobium americanum]
MSDLTSTLRTLEPHPGVFAYYDGRIEGRRLHGAEPNWLDDGAYELGVASYAVFDAGEALVYDTHISLAHAQAVRRHLEELGAKTIRVALSHWHNDHVAGNAVFADCEIIALKLTADLLHANREQLTTRVPPISPLVMPNRLFEARLDLEVGRRRVELHHFDIHSADGTILWLPDDNILVAGDTLEDTVTYVSEAENTAKHIRELARLATWPIDRILPNHGDPDRIAAGGYGASLVDANRRYLEQLMHAIKQGRTDIASLKGFIAEPAQSASVCKTSTFRRDRCARYATTR